jgi:HK97 family phage major capsid protein
MTLSEKLEAKRSEMKALTELVETEMRELNEEEKAKFDSLESECRSISDDIAAEQAEIERKAKETEDACKEFVKSEIEEGIRAMSKIDAEAELNKAYAELERAWQNYYEACEAAELEARKEELRSLIKEILNEPSARNEQLIKESGLIEAERLAKEELEEAKRALKEEQEAKLALENELKDNKRSKEQEIEQTRTMDDKNLFYEAFRGDDMNVEKFSLRADSDGDTTAMANGIPVKIGAVDIVGKAPIWEQMGVEVMRGAHGTYILPYDDPKVAQKLAELASVTGDAVNPSGITISPVRYSIQKTFTNETFASATPEFISSILSNMALACDRKITAEIYDKAYAGATEDADATDISKDSFDSLMGTVDIDGACSFLAPRSTFFAAKSVPIDEGSGRFLVEKISETQVGKGATYDGTPFWYSSLFADASGQYVVYGDLSKIHVADYGMADVIVDKYTLAGEGQVKITVSKIVCVALKNPDAFAKTANLSA